MGSISILFIPLSFRYTLAVVNTSCIQYLPMRGRSLSFQYTEATMLPSISDFGEGIPKIVANNERDVKCL